MAALALCLATCCFGTFKHKHDPILALHLHFQIREFARYNFFYNSIKTIFRLMLIVGINIREKFIN